MRRFTAPVAALLVLSACESLFTIRVTDEGTSTVPAATPLEVIMGDFGFGEFVSMDLTSASELQNQGVAPGDISEVYMELLELEAVSGNPDLSFIESIDVYVEAPGLPRVLLASQDDFPVGEALVALDLEDVDMTDYVVSESMTFDTDVSGSRPEDATDVTARFTVAVGVTGQGACGAIRGGDDG